MTLTLLEEFFNASMCFCVCVCCLWHNHEGDAGLTKCSTILYLTIFSIFIGLVFKIFYEILVLISLGYLMQFSHEILWSWAFLVFGRFLITVLLYCSYV